MSLRKPDEGLQLTRVGSNLATPRSNLDANLAYNTGNFWQERIKIYSKLEFKNLSHLYIVADHLLAGLITQDWVKLVLGKFDIVPQHLEKAGC